MEKKNFVVLVYHPENGEEASGFEVVLENESSWSNMRVETINQPGSHWEEIEGDLSEVDFASGSGENYENLIVYDTEDFEDDFSEYAGGSGVAPEGIPEGEVVDQPESHLEEIEAADLADVEITGSGQNYKNLIAYDTEDVEDEYAGGSGIELEVSREAEFDAYSFTTFYPDEVEEAAYTTGGGSGYGSVENYQDFVGNELERGEESVNIDPDDEYVNSGQEEISEDESNSNELDASIQAFGSDAIMYGGRPKRGRKRKVPNQSRADRKRLCNTNKTHINTKGDVYEEKSFDEQFECLCSRNCTGIVPVQNRQRLFNQFWSMGTFEGRCALLMSCVTEVPKKRSYSKDNIKNRSNTRKYAIYGQTVCQKTLLNTLKISESRITIALQKYMTQESLRDLRGVSRGGWNALSLSKTFEVRGHIASFPKYVSHYSRAKTEAKYLHCDLTLGKMYELYKEEAQDPVSLSFYNKIFVTHFNLRFKKPKSDTCRSCDGYDISRRTAVGKELQKIEKEHDEHIDLGESLQAQMKADLLAAKHDNELETLTFDQQKVQQLPKIPTSIVYYKRQLNLNNLGIHSGSTGKGEFNLWREDEASKGTQEVGSCLKLHIAKITKPIKRLILWSDSCGGQNRSIKLVLMMMFVLQNHKTLKSISMRYLLSGHSFLPNDTEFGEAETALKRHKLYTDEQYMEIMRNCRKKNGFVVNRMLPQNFFSVDRLEKLITNRKVDINNEKVSWLDTHEILLEKNQPWIIKMRTNTSGPFQTVNIKKIGCNLEMTDIALNNLWPTGRPLSKEKIKDLRELLCLIPQEHLYFYEFLNRVEEADFLDDIDGFGASIDFDADIMGE